MNILMLSCHSVLEHDELKLFSELGHDVFSVDSSYSKPDAPIDPKRPSLNLPYHEDLVSLGCRKENLDPKLIDWADAIVVMHKPEWVGLNWAKMKHKKVIWRTIGQSVPYIEKGLAPYRNEGLRIVRYSPAERRLKDYLGEDALIRFYKDPEEFKGWVGNKAEILNVTQSMKARGRACNWETFESVTNNMPRVVYGPGNEDLMCRGGQLDYEALKQAYRDYRVYFYTGTYPASYTLNFIEALMTGIPVVAIGPSMANIGTWEGTDTYEVHHILNHKVNGFCSDDIGELRGNLDYLLMHPELGKEMGEAGRKTAIELFGKEKISKQWKEYLESL